MTFALYIKQRRLELGLTQAQLAKVLDVDKQSVSNWECGRNEPWGAMQDRIVARLGERPRRQRVIERVLNDC